MCNGFRKSFEDKPSLARSCADIDDTSEFLIQNDHSCYERSSEVPQTQNFEREGIIKAGKGDMDTAFDPIFEFSGKRQQNYGELNKCIWSEERIR